MPQKSRSRLGILGGYADRRIAKRSEWHRSMCARMRRTIAGFLAKDSASVDDLFVSGGFSSRRHVEMNAATPTYAPLVELQNDLFNRPGYGSETSLPIAENCVFALSDYVTVPIVTVRFLGRLRRSNRQNFVSLIVNQSRHSPYQRPFELP